MSDRTIWNNAQLAAREWGFYPHNVFHFVAMSVSALTALGELKIKGNDEDGWSVSGVCMYSKGVYIAGGHTLVDALTGALFTANDTWEAYP